MSRRIPIVSVVGRGGAGRTTLLEGVIRELSSRGWRVATAKHHAHETDIDTPGKDTWRHARAGAVVAMVSAPNRLGVFSQVERERTLDELMETAGDVDILLTEGFSSISPVLVEIVRRERGATPRFPLGSLFALVTDVPELASSGTPIFPLDDVVGLSDLIEGTFLSAKGRARGSSQGVLTDDVSLRSRDPNGGFVEGDERGRVLVSRVYLDNAATSWPKPAAVVDAVARGLTELGGSPGRGAHALALSASRALMEARRVTAALLGVRQPRNLIFQPSCTVACNLMLHGALEPGDRVVVGSMEHNAITRPLAKLAELGVEVVVVRADESGLVDPGDMEKEVRARRTRAVICQHASNVSGTIQLVAELSEVAHENGALFLVDGAQAVGHLDVDLSLFAPDVYVASGHKGLLGPPGIGIAFLSPTLEVKEQVTGGTGGGGALLEMPSERPERYEVGTVNLPGILGVAAGATMLAEKGEELRDRTSRLSRRLHEGMLGLGLTVLGPAPSLPRVPLVSVVHPGLDPDRFAFLLDRDHGVASRAGLHCAPWAHETLGTLENGALRFSVGWATMSDDVEHALAAVKRILSLPGT